MRRRLSLVLLTALAVAGCGGGDPEPTTSPSPTVTAGASPTTLPNPTSSPSSRDDVTVVEIVVADGEVEGGIARPEVELGSAVRFEVTSDTADHVHLHGYDLLEDVEAGGTAVLEFTADIPGKFEVELEDQRVKIAELTVTG